MFWKKKSSLSVRSLWRRRANLDFASGTENPSAIYKEGVEAKNKLEKARQIAAARFAAPPSSIVFTSGATEANNLAIGGILKAWYEKNPGQRPAVLISPYEHKSVIEAAKIWNPEIVEIPTEGEGNLDLKSFKKILAEKDFVLVGCSYASGETGVRLPVREIAKLIRNFRKAKSKNQEANTFPYLHIDISQGILTDKITLDSTGADTLSLGGAKIFGPHGAGVLILRAGTQIAPILGGGGQENGIRPGTENLKAILEMTDALEHAEKNREKFSAHCLSLKNYFLRLLSESLPEVAPLADEGLPNILTIKVPNIESELLVIELDALGIAASSASACSIYSTETTRAYEVLGIDLSKWGILRFSFGPKTSRRDIRRTVRALGRIQEKYKNFSSFPQKML